MRKIFSLSFFILLGFLSLPHPFEAATGTVVEDRDSKLGIKTYLALDSTQRRGNITYFEVGMKPGQQKEFRLYLENTTSENRTFTIEPGIGSTTNFGNIKIVDPNSSLNLIDPEDTMTNWFELKDEVITLKPGEKKRFTFSVSVPEDKSGFYAGGLRFVPVSPLVSEEGKNNFKKYNEIEQILPFFLNIGNPLTPAIHLQDVSLSFESDKPKLFLTLQNSERAPASFQNIILSITNPITKETKEIELLEMLFAPNTFIHHKIDWPFDDLPIGDWDFTLSGTTINANGSLKEVWNHTEQSFILPVDQEMNQMYIDNIVAINKLQGDNSSVILSFWKWLFPLVGILIYLSLLSNEYVKWKKDRKRRKTIQLIREIRKKRHLY